MSHVKNHDSWHIMHDPYMISAILCPVTIALIVPQWSILVYSGRSGPKWAEVVQSGPIWSNQTILMLLQRLLDWN